MRNVRNKFFSSLAEPLLDLNTAAALLGVSVSTITRYIDDGTIAAVITHRGKRKLTRKIRPSTLSAWLSGNSSRPPEGGGDSNLQSPPLPPLAIIRPGVSVGFDGMPPPFGNDSKEEVNDAEEVTDAGAEAADTTESTTGAAADVA